MIKKILKLGVILILILVIFVFYLSYFGIETKRFNQLIKDEITKSNKEIDIELNKVKIILNLKKLSVSLKTHDPKIIFKDKKIKLKKIKTNFSIESFLKKDFAVENLFISTKENTINDFIGLARIYQNNLQFLIFDKMVKGGNLKADLNLLNSPLKRFIIQICLIILFVISLNIQIEDVRIDWFNKLLLNNF